MPISGSLLRDRDELENAKTHDDLWNASQNEMKYHGKMSSWNRMYWAKKVVLWLSIVDSNKPLIWLDSGIYMLLSPSWADICSMQFAVLLSVRSCPFAIT